MTDLVLERFWEDVQVQPNGCWLWNGTKNQKGYARFHFEGRYTQAHRFAYQVNKGQILEGLIIDHLCRNKNCVNPEHLEAVTNRENILRGNSVMAQKARQTHCKKGHPLSGDNLVVYRNSGRRCKTCEAENNKKRWWNVTKPNKDDI